jgi:hypothetical protein
MFFFKLRANINLMGTYARWSFLPLLKVYSFYGHYFLTLQGLGFFSWSSCLGQLFSFSAFHLTSSFPEVKREADQLRMVRDLRMSGGLPQLPCI